MKKNRKEITMMFKNLDFNGKEVKWMKRIGSVLAGLMLFLVVGANIALATPFMPPAGPLYIKFDNHEQISPSGTMQSPSGASESNWGIFKVSSIATGNALNDPQNFTSGTQIWADIQPGEITGMFGGIQLRDLHPGAIDSKGGSLYLYWDDVENASLGAATVGQRTGDSIFTNFTDGTLLAKIDFVPGAIVPGEADTTIRGSAVPLLGFAFFGAANSYGNIDLAAGGLWAALLDEEYFDTLLGQNTADMKFRNVYENGLLGIDSWDGVDASGNKIFGAQSTDPARAYATPEPATIGLLGMGLVGLARVTARQRRK